MVKPAQSVLLHSLFTVLQYYTVLKAESWMNDKKLLVTNGEYGKDEDGKQALIAKLEAIELMAAVQRWGRCRPRTRG